MIISRRLKALYLLFTLLLGTSSLWGQTEDERDLLGFGGSDAGSVTVYWENDLFAGTDGSYTNGGRIAWLSNAYDYDNLPVWAVWMSSMMPFKSPKEYRYQYGLSLTQQIFTPEDVLIGDLITDDRPYAGWLALGFAVHAKRNNRLHSLEASFGLVGPGSFAEEAQTEVHRLRDLAPPEGWDNQLENEPTFNLFYTTKWRLARTEKPFDDWDWDMIPRVGFSLGNALTDINAGLTVRFGYHMPRDFVEHKISLTAYDDRLYDYRQEPFGFYGFFGVDSRIILHNLFLDGNSFRDSHSVDKHYAVGEVFGGFGMVLGSWKVTYTHTWRTPEFDSQEQTQLYGSISIGRSF